jgi:hypothetical protein
MKLRALLRTLPLVLAIGLLAGCSKDDTPVDPNNNGNNNNNNGSGAVGLTLAPSSSTIWVADTVKLTATVTGSANTGVNWTITPALGTVDNAGNYIAPQSITGESVEVTIKATAAADSTISATSHITIKGPAFTTVKPGVGSSYVYDVFATDSLGRKLEGSDRTLIYNVPFADAAFGGATAVTAFQEQTDTTFIQYDPKGDILMAYPAEDGKYAWLRMPFGTKEPVDVLVVDHPYDDGSHYTYRYQAEFVGSESVQVGTNSLTVYTVRTTTTGTRTGADARVTKIETSYLYAPSIGWFAKISDLLTRTDNTGTLTTGTVTELQNYLVK